MGSLIKYIYVTVNRCECLLDFIFLGTWKECTVNSSEEHQTPISTMTEEQEVVCSNVIFTKLSTVVSLLFGDCG